MYYVSHDNLCSVHETRLQVQLERIQWRKVHCLYAEQRSRYQYTTGPSGSKRSTTALISPEIVTSPTRAVTGRVAITTDRLGVDWPRYRSVPVPRRTSSSPAPQDDRATAPRPRWWRYFRRRRAAVHRRPRWTTAAPRRAAQPASNWHSRPRSLALAGSTTVRDMQS